MAPLAFISHASTDKTAAEKICAGLEERGIRCWIAPRDIKPGRSFPQALIDAVAECSVVVLVLSARANVSDAVTAEVMAATKRNKTIIPVRIEDVRPEGSLEFLISQTHWLDAFAQPDHLDRLAAVIREPFNQESVTAPDASPESLATGAKRVQVFFHGSHERALIPATTIAEHFEAMGWQVERGYTELSIHEYGLWVHGSNDDERAFAVRILHALGFEPRIDDRAEDVPLQIIVGQTGRSPMASTYHVRRPPAPTPPVLKVRLVFVDNAGGTPGLHVKATNGERTPLEAARVVVTDIRRWDDGVKAFVTSRDIYDSGTTFREMEIGRATLHTGELTNVGFIRSEGSRVELSGATQDAPQDHYRIRTAGVWQVSLRVDGKDGRTTATALCFRWEGADAPSVSPTPWDCPSA